MRIFWDERGYEVTENQMLWEYNNLKYLGEIDPGITFPQFLRNCTDKNGTLTEVKNAIQAENC